MFEELLIHHVYAKLLGTKDCIADREQTEDGVDDGGLELKLEDAKVIAFPHEHHWQLYQEFLEVFGGPGNITVIDFSVGSGAKTPGCPPLQWEGSRSARSQFHRKWVMQNLTDWVRQKRLVTIAPLPKPQVALISLSR